jgi:hypothetical protein
VGTHVLRHLAVCRRAVVAELTFVLLDSRVDEVVAGHVALGCRGVLTLAALERLFSTAVLSGDVHREVALGRSRMVTVLALVRSFTRVLSRVCGEPNFVVGAVVARVVGADILVAR